ncbi:hypothetical protein J4234_00730 [Candidatus Woesearchaeota archaeon]|nr:hypothetical protein [Candidatus Woesearchaeota archaeon]
MESNYSPWELITDYDEVGIKARHTYFTSSFELYKSKEEELAWSPDKDQPHINPQKGVRVSTATDLDIGKMLAEMASFELKIPQIPAFLMVKDNRDLVTRILNEIKGK